jgi:uncharacterized membrane protein
VRSALIIKEMRKFDLQKVKFLCWTAFICGSLVGFVIAMVLYAFGIWW